jgi:hypothetical protein
VSDLSDFKRHVHEPLERQAHELRLTVAFLSRRLIREAGDNGVSSDMLVAAAATGSVVPDDVYPHDSADFGRCCGAYSLAPSHLRRKMLPQLVAWGNDLAERESTRGW